MQVTGSVDPRMKEIRDEVLACRKCPLHSSRKWPVIGQGCHQAEIVLVAEAPGATENMTGRPFCGAAGKVLDQLLQAAGLGREAVYITNILKCRPPGNRDPQPEEIEACTPFLLRHLEIIQPKTVGCLGRFASRFVMEQYGLAGSFEGMGRVHGKVFISEGEKAGVRIVPLYHPAAAAYNPNMLATLKEDFLRLVS